MRLPPGMTPGPWGLDRQKYLTCKKDGERMLLADLYDATAADRKAIKRLHCVLEAACAVVDSAGSVLAPSADFVAVPVAAIEALRAALLAIGCSE